MTNQSRILTLDDTRTMARRIFGEHNVPSDSVLRSCYVGCDRDEAEDNMRYDASRGHIGQAAEIRAFSFGI